MNSIHQMGSHACVTNVGTVVAVRGGVVDVPIEGDVLVFAHMKVLRILAARWVAQSAVEARRLHRETASVSVLGYDLDLDEPVIRPWNDARHPRRLRSSPPEHATSERS